jgi:hypothetical protein
VVRDDESRMAGLLWTERMTKSEWLSLQVGDVIVDHKCGDVHRTVLSVKRNSGKPTQRGNTRTTITVPNIKSRGRTTVLFSTDDTGFGTRFSLVPRVTEGM